MMKSLTIGLILAGRRNVTLSTLQKEFSRPFTAPLCLRTIAAIINQANPDIEIKLFDENLYGETPDKFIRSVDICFISGLSTSHYGMRRIAQKARMLGKKVIAGGMGVTCFYAADPVTNIAEMSQYFHGICAGRLTVSLCRRIIADCENNCIQPVYSASCDEPMEFIIPRHDLGRGKYCFNAVITSSNGCSSNCGFCAVHHCLPGGIRGIHYPKPVSFVSKELEALDEYPLFFDGADSFGEDLTHTFGDGENPASGILPLYRESGKRWITEAKIEILKGEDGRWKMLEEIARANNLVMFVGIEDLWHKIAKKQVTKEDVEEAIKRGHDLGLLMVCSIIIDGSPLTTPDDVERTIDWCVNSGAAFQFSCASALDGTDFKNAALKAGTLIDNNPENTDGAWPQFERAHLSPEYRINALVNAYQSVYAPSRIAKRFLERGPFKQNTWLAALVELGVLYTNKKWAKTYDYGYWLEHRIEP